MLVRHILISAVMLFSAMLIAGWQPAYILPLYAFFLIPVVPVASVVLLGTERSEGTVELLCCFPVPGWELALGRVLALGEGCILAGLFTAAGFVAFLAADGLGPTLLLTAGVAAFFGASIPLLAVGTTVLWLALRFRSDTLATIIPMGFLLGVLLLARVLPPLGEIWSGIVALGASLTGLMGGIAVLSALVLPVVFLLLSRALDRCVLDPTRSRPKNG